MKELKKGMLAKSLAGHDKDRIYVIIDVEDEYVFLADGVHKTSDCAKKKNRKHIQPIKRKEAAILTDEAIINVIKEYQDGQ